MSRPALSVVRTDPAPAGAALSSGSGAGTSLAADGARPFNLRHYRRVFPDHWSAFLRAHFRDHLHAAFVFGVSERCARNWWEGVSGPRAEVALAACKHIPGAADQLMRAA